MGYTANTPVYTGGTFQEVHGGVRTAAVPLQRVARVRELEPLADAVPQEWDHVDDALDKSTFGAKTLLLVTVVLFTAIWGTWNLKNALKIDLIAGPHQEMIDEVNEAFGI
jgi:hypothetical protein